MSAEAGAWRLERRLRSRLGGLLLLSWALGTGLALSSVGEETDEVLDSALIETAQLLLDLPGVAFDPGAAGDVPAGFGPHREYLVYQVFDSQGRMHLRSHQAPVQPLAPPQARGLSEQGGWRVAALQAGPRRVLVAEPLAHRREVLWETCLWLLLPLLLVLPLGAVGLHRVLRGVFGALSPARQALERREALPLQGMPQELLPLLGAVNEMRQRLQDQVEAERAFAARMAHELRTPLAAARAHAQRLLSDTDPRKTHQRVQVLLRQIDRVTALASRLLQMARVDAGLALRREAVDLKLLAQMVLDEFAADGQAGRLTLHASAQDCVVLADLDALGIALRNLVDNALRHAGPAARVEVFVEPRSLLVRDDGPGAALPQGPEAGPSTGSGGSGLGLPLVRKIAQQTGATLSLRSPLQHGRGFEAALSF
nr:histidine kinase dimerization/phospho-acceptor domain-containing protein [uncultured Roseateles sp.]